MAGDGIRMCVGWEGWEEKTGRSQTESRKRNSKNTEPHSKLPLVLGRSVSLRILSGRHFAKVPSRLQGFKGLAAADCPRHVPIASNMDPERVRAYLQVACAGLGFDIGEVWFTSNENGSSTVAQIGTLSLLFEFFRVLCVRFIASCSPKDSQDRSLLLFSRVA